MVLELARQSIIIKANRDNNTILGNYECAYAMGLLSKLSGIPVLEEHSDIPSLFFDFAEKLEKHKFSDIREQRLQKILLLYKPLAFYDEQVEALLQWGLKEEKPWEM